MARILGLLVLLLGARAYAQNDMPTPPVPGQQFGIATATSPPTDVAASATRPARAQASVMQFWFIERFYPVGVRAVISLNRPLADDVATLRLTLSDGAGWSATLAVDDLATDARARVFDTVVQPILDWRLPPNTPLFTPLAARLVLVNTDGTTAAFTDTLVLAPHGVAWASGAAGDVRVAVPNTVSPDGLARAVAPSVRQLAIDAGATPPALAVALVPPGTLTGCRRDEAGALVAASERDAGAVVACRPADERRAQAADWVLVPSTRFGGAQAQALLLEQAVRAVHPDAPGAVRLGLAALYAPTPQPVLLADARAASRVGQPLNAATLNSPGADERARAHAIGWALYVADVYGLPALHALAAAGTPLDEAVPGVLGVPLEATLRAYDVWLYTDAAARAFSTSRVGAATPTPSATVLPSATPSRTPTFTPSPTASATATATVPPTRTTAPTPTITPTPTPRRARDVFTATPPATAVPPAAPTSAVSREVLLAGSVFLMLAGAVIIGVALITRRR